MSGTCITTVSLPLPRFAIPNEPVVANWSWGGFAGDDWSEGDGVASPLGPTG